MQAVQWFFDKSVGWLALLGGALHLLLVLGFVAVVEGWGRDLRMDALLPWMFLTGVSALICFCVAYGANQIARFNADRPWFNLAQSAEKEAYELRKRVRSLEEDKDTLTASNRTLNAAKLAVEDAARGTQQTINDLKDRNAYLEPRHEAAVKFLRGMGKRIVTVHPGNTVEITDQ